MVSLSPDSRFGIGERYGYYHYLILRAKVQSQGYCLTFVSVNQLQTHHMYYDRVVLRSLVGQWVGDYLVGQVYYPRRWVYRKRDLPV